MKRFRQLALQKRLTKINVKAVFKNNSQITLPKDSNFTLKKKKRLPLFLHISMDKLKLLCPFEKINNINARDCFKK